MNAGNIVIGTELDTKSFDEQIKQTERKLEKLEKTYQKALNPSNKFKVSNDMLNKYREEIEKTSNKLVDLRKKQASLYDDPEPTTNILEKLKDVGKEIKKNIKNVVSWGLAIFGIRGAFNFIRNSMSIIASQDEQLQADINYMRNALAYTLEPIIRRIVDLTKQLMFYVGYIIKAWTGKNIFANANKSLKNATGSAKALNKELNKTQASFDEMEVLNDTSSSGGGDGGITTPSFDLSNLDIEVPSWLKWMADNRDLILSLITGIASGFTAIKLGLTAIQGLGIGIAVAGLVYAILALMKYLKDPTWGNFAKIIQGIGVFVIGLGIAFASLPAIIAGVIVLIVGIIIKYWEQIKSYLVNAVKWLEDSIDAVRNTFGDDIANIYQVFIDMFKGVIIGFNELFSGLKQILDGIIKFIKGVFTGNWKMAWEGILDIFSGIINSLIGIFRTVISVIGGLAKTIVMTIGYTIRDIFKAIINGVLNAIENIINYPIWAINGLIKTINTVSGINLGILPTFKFPRLAKGGIINMPGRGIPVGNAIGGEKGMEGVIPLTDSQQMQLLGEAIGKYITVNANITNTMNGRIISRELQKISAEDDFAFNR